MPCKLTPQSMFEPAQHCIRHIGQQDAVLMIKLHTGMGYASKVPACSAFFCLPHPPCCFCLSALPRPRLPPLSVCHLLGSKLIQALTGGSMAGAEDLQAHREVSRHMGKSGHCGGYA